MELFQDSSSQDDWRYQGRMTMTGSGGALTMSFISAGEEGVGRGGLIDV